VTFIQRFGSALNLNVHFHMLFLDGVYVTRCHDGNSDDNNTSFANASPHPCSSARPSLAAKVSKSRPVSRPSQPGVGVMSAPIYSSAFVVTCAFGNPKASPCGGLSSTADNCSDLRALIV